MTYDTFVGLTNGTSIAGSTWDGGGITWDAGRTYLEGNGANVVVGGTVASDTVVSAQFLGQTTNVGHAMFFTPGSGRPTTFFTTALSIHCGGVTASPYGLGGIRVSVGEYGLLVLKDLDSGADVSVAAPISDSQEYCMEVYKTTNANNKEYEAKLYQASAGVRGTLVATTPKLTLANARTTTDRMQQLFIAAPNITFNRFETIDPVADLTAPVLSTPTATVTTSTTATGGVATDEAGGFLYYLITSSATPPSVATIKAGSSQTVAATGAQSVSLTGLTPGVTKYLHFVQTDATGVNNSNIATTAGFTPPVADTTPPVQTGSITIVSTTSGRIDFSYSAATDDVGVVGYQISKDAGLNWINNGTGLTGYFTGLTANTAYQIWVRAYDNGSPVNYSAPLTATISTAAPATGSFTSIKFCNNTASGYPAGTSVSWEWRQNGRIGAVATSVTYGTGTLSSDGTLTVTNCPLGNGYLLATVRGATYMLDKPFYQPGTVT